MKVVPHRGAPTMQEIRMQAQRGWRRLLQRARVRGFDSHTPQYGYGPFKDGSETGRAHILRRSHEPASAPEHARRSQVGWIGGRPRPAPSPEEWATRNRILAATLAALINEHAPHSTDRAIDVGCQWGMLLESLARQTTFRLVGCRPTGDAPPVSRRPRACAGRRRRSALSRIASSTARFWPTSTSTSIRPGATPPSPRSGACSCPAAYSSASCPTRTFRSSRTASCP